MSEKLKICKTVGQLIKELQKLPESSKLDDPIRPVHYNTGETAKLLNLKPVVGFEKY